MGLIALLPTQQVIPGIFTIKNSWTTVVARISPLHCEMTSW